MAAAARPPGLGDARMPCPLCGGLIHPVAGRCKHCKEDLSAFRAGRPQAAAPLPTLGAIGAATTTSLPGGTTIHTPPAAVAAITAREGSQPILPQRPTGRSMAAQKAGGSLWKSWPMVVIGVAVLAIVTAVVIMVLPQDTKASRKKIGAPPPAPERMDLDPMPKSGQLTPPTGPNGGDPWASPDYPAPQPQQVPVPDPQANNDPNDPNGQADPNDLFNGLGGAAGGDAMFAIYGKACEKAKTCPNVDQTMLSAVCAAYSTGTLPKTSSCAAAKRCMDEIDQMSCSTTNAMGLVAAVTTIQDCATAFNDC